MVLGTRGHVCGHSCRRHILLPLAAAALIARRDMSRLEKVLLGLLMFLSLAIYRPSLKSELSQMLGASYFIVSTVLLALYFATRQHYRLFHAMTIAVGIRFLIIYFQVFEDLAYTGIGLVISGLVIIGLAVTWFKYRPRLETWVKRLVE